MATTYFEDVTASDLSSPGGSFQHILTETQPGSLGSDSLSAASGGGTATGFYVSPIGDPGSSGISTGTFTFKLNVTVSASGVFIRPTLMRLNSSGALQASQAMSQDTSGTTGVKTFTFSNPALGTWSSGDRLAVQVVVTNSNSHGGAKGATWETGGSNDVAITTWTLASVVTGGASLFSTGTLSATGKRSTNGAVSLSALSSLAASGHKSTFGGAALTSTTTLSAAGTRVTGGAASLAASASLSASGTVSSGAATITGGASLSATSTLSASGVRSTRGGTALSSSSTISASGVRIVYGGYTGVATASLTATGFVSTTGSASLSASATLTAIPSSAPVVDPVIIQKTGTSSAAVMQKAATGYTYIIQKTGTSATPVSQKALAGWTQVSG